MFILQAGIGAGILLLVLNVGIIIIGLPVLTIILTNTYEKKKLRLQASLTTLELFLIILKAFIFSVFIISGMLIVVNFIFYLVFDLSMS